MAYKRIRILIFLLIFTITIFGISFLKNAYAFGKYETHPELTEEIVKFYNSQANKKITAEELALIKLGSQKEDDSPRWFNHYYDAIHNIGLTAKYLRGNPQLVSSWDQGMNFASPKKPLKSIDWLKNEEYQLIYGANRTWQKAIRGYFDKKEEGLIALGSVLHLMEDMGVPEHTRNDGHIDFLQSFFHEVPSYYEKFAEKVNINSLNIANNLIQQGAIPYQNGNLENIFFSLSSFTANNWFSEDTIGVEEFANPKISIQLEKDKYIFYYDNSNRFIAMGVPNKQARRTINTTHHDKIQQQWLTTITPEIVKYGANLLNVYFAEIEKRKQDETNLDIDRLEARDRRVKRIYRPLVYINGKVIVWRSLDTIANIQHSIANTVTNLFQNQQNQNTKNNSENNSKPKITLNQLIAIAKPVEIKPAKTIQTQSLSENTLVAYEETFALENVEEQSAESNLNNTNTANNIPAIPVVLKVENPKIQHKSFFESTTTQFIQSFVSPALVSPKPQSQYAVVTGGSSQQVSTPVSAPTSTNKCDQLQSQTFSKIIISEFQYETTASTTDEFIELYNPNNSLVSLDCFELRKITSSGTESTLIPQSKFEGAIQPHSFFLITHPLAKDKYTADLIYAESYSFSKNNVLILINPAGNISDLVGFGDDKAKITNYETNPYLPMPGPISLAVYNVERINLQDTDNNEIDFWLTNPNPENTKSPIRMPRADFVDLRNVNLQNLSASFDSNQNKITIQFQEPNFSIDSFNYQYVLQVSTSTSFSSALPVTDYPLIDFGSTSTIPAPKFGTSSFIFETTATKCPASESLYNVATQLFYKLITQNITFFSTSTLDFSGFCNPQSQDNLAGNNLDIQKGKILISEIKIASASSTKDEYVELYNPNAFAVNLSNFFLVKTNKNNNDQTIIPQSKFKGIIKPFSFFLLANASSSEMEKFGVAPDLTWPHSYDFAKTNSAKLLDSDKNILDYVWWNDIGYQVLERKAGASSTSESLKNSAAPNGEKNFGNSFDTDLNDDFVLTDSEPQNSNVSEIPPNSTTRLNLALNNINLTLSFVSPYQSATGTLIYELRVASSSFSSEQIKTNWSNLQKIDIALPAVRIGGYNEQLEFNACGKIQQNDFLVLGILKDSNIFSFDKIQLLDSPHCAVTKKPDNLTLQHEYYQYSGCEPHVRKIIFRNETENSQVEVSLYGGSWPSVATTSYLKLAQNQVFSYTFEYQAGCRLPINDSFKYQITALATSLDDSTSTVLYSENFTEVGAPPQFFPAAKSFQAKIPNNAVKLKIILDCWRVPIAPAHREIFWAVVEILID